MKEVIPEFIDIAEDVDFPKKEKTRGKRIKKNYSKAIRKASIAKQIYPSGYHAVLGHYLKGKIHCSCPMCAAKTNARLNKSMGPVSSSKRHGARLAVTNRRYGRKNYKPSDMRKVDSMECQLQEYEPELVFV